MNQTDLTYPIPSQPRQLRLDTTTVCNAACLSCHRHISQRRGTMSGELIDKILRDVSQWANPLEEIVPVNYGEFFTCDDWWAILKQINKYLPCTRIVIPTNGTLIDQSMVDKFCQITTLKIINFSVNAFFDGTYAQFMGLDAGYKNRIPNLIKSIKVERPDIIIWASMVFDPQYQSDLERDKFIEFWQSQNVIPQILPAASANRPDKKVLIPRTEPCWSIFSDFVVGFDGKLSSCCFDSGMVLDLGQYSGALLSDWQNEKITALRKAHNEHRREGFCERCSFA